MKNQKILQRQIKKTINIKNHSTRWCEFVLKASDYFYVQCRTARARTLTRNLVHLNEVDPSVEAGTQ